MPETKLFYSVEDLVNGGFGSRTTIWRRIKAGELPAIKDGHRVLIPVSAFNEYIYRLRAKSAN